jgi:O-antigen biosynthesis protein
VFKPLKVVDLELSRPLDSVHDLTGPGEVQALVRWHGLPLGRFTSAAPPGDGADITRAIAVQHWRTLMRRRLRAALQAAQSLDHLGLDDLQQIAPPPYSGPRPLVTVAVCTRNRPADLGRCLDALMQLDYPALDVLVVDNAPDGDATARLVAGRYPRVRHVCEPRPGLDWARNRAIQEARGEILAFTDDDAIVDPGWVTALVRVFAEDPEVMAVTGLVVPYELETDAQHLFERYGGFGRGYEREWHSVPRRPDRADTLYIGAGLYGTGANMAYRRRVFETIGTFDPALDVGTVTLGGGDLDMFFRVLHHGLLLVYEPAALVRHRHRRTQAELLRQLDGWGSGFYAYLARNVSMERRARGPIIRFGLWYFWRRYVRRLLASLVSPTVPRALILAELRGALAGVSRYRRARAAAATIAATPVPAAATSEAARL